MNVTFWTLVQSLPLENAPFMEAPSKFGESVLIDGDFLMVGSPDGRDIAFGGSRGTVYYVDVNELTDPSYLGEILTSSNISDVAELGTDLAIDDGVLATSAPKSTVSGEDAAGQLFVYDFDPSSSLNNGFLNEAIYNTDQPIAQEEFGNRIAINNGSMLIGCSRNRNESNEDLGAVDIFFESGGTWSYEDRLIALDEAINTGFGSAVAINNNKALIGAYLGKNKNEIDAGAVHLMSRGINSFEFANEITAIDGKSQDWFGYDLALTDDYLLIGAPGNDENGTDAGAAYIIPINRIDCPGIVSVNDTVETEFASNGAFMHSQAVIQNGGVLDLVANQSITFYPGFSIAAGNELTATIDTLMAEGCGKATSEPDFHIATSRKRGTQAIPKSTAVFSPNPATNYTKLSLDIPATATGFEMTLVDGFGRVVRKVIHDNLSNGDTFAAEFATHHLQEGLYFAQVEWSDQQVEMYKLLVQRF